MIDHDKKILVRVERYFKYPEIMQQTPNASGVWNDIQFTEEAVEQCDFLVILDHPRRDIKVKVNPLNVIHLSLEPPNEMTEYRQYANSQNKLIINQIYTGPYSVQAHGALPWHLNKSYDDLSALRVNDLNKENKICWITSNQSSTKGHKRRMQFLDKIKAIDGVEIYGRGINPVADKWDVLSLSQYGIAYENFNSNYYWTEKIVDCFLSYTMPLYIGTSNIVSYFPRESFIQVDPEQRDIEPYLKSILKSKHWEKNIEAITHSRNLILEKYQLFPYLHTLIKYRQTMLGEFLHNERQWIEIKSGDRYFDNYPWTSVFHKNYHKIRRKLSGFNIFRAHDIIFKTNS